MADIAGIPYVEATFDKKGKLENDVTLPAGVSDLFVISHGWNNSAAAARDLYRRFFESFAAVAEPNDLPGRTFAILGVIWPSKEFDELVAVSGEPGGAEGSASIAAAASQSRKALEAKLARMKELFVDAAQHQLLDQANALIGDLEEKASARREFVNTIRSLLDPAAANKEDASDSFFKDDGNELMKNLKVDEEDLDQEVAAPGGGPRCRLAHAPRRRRRRGRRGSWTRSPASAQRP
jgi:hypothetical protein